MYEFKHDEDTVGMIQLLPVGWRAYCLKQFEAIEEHASPEGFGITSMYRLPPDPSLPRLAMTADEFIELLSPHGKRFDKITSNLGDLDEMLGIRCIGFGSGIERESGWGNKGLIGELDGDRVSSIWCRLWTNDPHERDILADMLMAVSRHQHLLLVDWNRSGLADLRSRPEILAYLDD